MVVTGGSAGPLDGALLTGVPVLSRTMWLAGLVSGTGISNGVSTWGFSQRRHVVLADCTGLELVFAWAGAYESSTGSPYPGTPTNNGTIRCTVWHQAANPNTGGSPIDVLFGGATSVSIEPLQIVASDAIAGLTLTKGDVLWTRTRTDVPAGGTWPLGGRSGPFGTDGGKEGTGAPATDWLHAGALGGSMPDSRFHPVSSRAVLV